MSTIHEFTTVACPFDAVTDRLAAHFEGGSAIIPLRVKFGDLKIERDVEFHLKSKPAYPGYKLLDVSWAPKDGGPYPTFAGTLSVAEDAVGWSRIEIDGKYKPPFGIAGAAFDAAIGHRVAQGTASELLGELKRILTTEPAQRLVKNAVYSNRAATIPAARIPRSPATRPSLKVRASSMADSIDRFNA